MKKILMFFSSSLLVLLIGCGGGDDNVPPPAPPQLAMNNPTDQQQLKDMMALSQQTKSHCSNSATQSLIPMMSVLSGGNAPGGCGTANCPQSNSPVLPSLGGDCSNSLINFLLMFASMKNGEYAKVPETRPWFISQLGGIINRVGMNLVALGYKPQDFQQKLYQTAWQLTQRDIFSQPNFQTVHPAVCGQIGQYGGAC